MSPRSPRPCCQKWRPRWAIAAVACSSLLYVGVAAKESLPPQTAASANETFGAENETTTTTTKCDVNVSETETTTTTTSYWACNAGTELRANRTGELACRLCEPNFYKSDIGPGSCLPCPSDATTLFVGIDTITGCLCNDTAYKDGNDTMFSCMQCPPRSAPYSVWVSTTIQSCLCKERDIRVPENGVLEYCREPRPCNVPARLETLNLTGPPPKYLQMGTCGNQTQLEHRGSCNLICTPGTAPQARSNIIEAIDVSVFCEDGEITKYPAVGTWCSRDAYLLPPLVFLGTVAVAGVLAGTFIERRQHRWSEECAQALRFKFLRPTLARQGMRTSLGGHSQATTVMTGEQSVMTLTSTMSSSFTEDSRGD